MSSSPGVLPMSFASLQYRDIADGPMDTNALLAEQDRPADHNKKRRAEVEMSEAEFAARIRQERADATAQAEQKLRQDYEQKLAAARMPIASTVKEFAEQREDYFARAEAEVVQLSLAIAAKILHREAQVDPMLVASLVRIAIDKMREESSITVRVSAGRGATWKAYLAGFPNLARVEVAEDAQLSSQDCVLETELGAANFGLDTQLKEVEQGFFDLMALRPTTR
jgi:flagellar assembly protein FliH